MTAASAYVVLGTSAMVMFGGLWLAMRALTHGLVPVDLMAAVVGPTRLTLYRQLAPAYPALCALSAALAIAGLLVNLTG